MTLSRRWSVFLLLFGVWSWVIWPTFIHNIANDPRAFTGNRPHAFFVVHLVLTVVSLIPGDRDRLAGCAGAARRAGRTQERVTSG